MAGGEAIRFLRFNDRRVAYTVSGDGPPLVAPAWWVSHLELDWSDHRFRELWNSVAEGYSLVRYDRLGVGMSDRDLRHHDLTVDADVALLRAMLDELGMDQVLLLGGSSGGCAAIAFAARCWPLLRRCALGLGRGAQNAGAIGAPEDVFFLTRAELRVQMGARGLQDVVARRRAEWEQQRRLVAPLTIGQAPQLLERSLTGVVDAVRTGGQLPDGAIVGQPASPGRASGPVRVVRGPQEFDQFKDGEVLVARVTAPMWTPLFAREAAVVTDGGSLAAHASLVAREYGIPAVVATGAATRRLRDGQNVTVDGSAGFVQADN